MENRAFGALVTALLLCCAHSAPATSEPLRILYAEPFQAQATTAPGAQQKTAPVNLRVRAFGRTFELELEDNSRLLRATSARIREHLGAVQVLKGTVKDAPGSWVRLTSNGDRYSGAFWDGSELYAVAPRETLDSALRAPMAAAASGIYRLSDTQGGLFAGSCGLDSSKATAVSPIAKFRALVRELQAATAAVAAPREIEVSMIGDFELHARFGGAEFAAMIDQVNVVDGIFSSQVGVDTIPTDFITFDSDSDPFTSADASTLLSQVGTYRQSNAAVRSRGLAHLLTGRRLAGNTIGIAFLGSLCEAREGVSLSESSSFVDSPLVMAHEIGHNFGAPHDGEPGSACVGTPTSFLMAPQLTGSNTFSACSLQQMQPHINAAACIVASRNREVAVSTPVDTIIAPVNEPFDVTFDVASIGDTTAINVTLDVTLPFGSLLISTAMPGAACLLQGNNTMRCRLPSLAAGASSRLTLSMRHSAAALIDFPATVSAVGDGNSANNASTVHVRVTGAKDFEVTATPATQTVPRGSPFAADIDVTALGIQTLSAMRLQLFLGGVSVLAATIDNGTCTTIQLNPTLVCELGAMPPGDRRHLHVQLVSDRIEQLFGQIFVFEAGNSGFQRTASFIVNNKAIHDVSVFANPLLRIVAIGSDATWTVEARSTGVQQVDGVHLQVSAPAGVHLSVDGPTGEGCTTIAGGLDCSIGSIAAGAIKTLTLRGRANTPLRADIDLRVIAATPDDVPSNDFHTVAIDARVASEIGLFGLPAMDVAAFEAHTHSLLVTAFTSGANPTREVRLAIALPQNFTISEAAFGAVPCTVRAAAPNLADCAVPQLETDRHTTLIVTYVPGQPGVFDGSVTVTAGEDADPSNNTLPLRFEVAPNIDARVLAPATPRVALGVGTDIVFTVATNKYALPDASVRFGVIGSLDELSATAPGAACALGAQGLVCELGTIAANSTVLVTLHIRASVPTAVSLAATLSSPAETNFADNQAFVNFPIMAPGDVTLSVVEPTGVTVGQEWHLLIDINVLAQAQGPYMELLFETTRSTLFGSNTGTFCQSPQPPVRCTVGSFSPDMLAPGIYRADVIFIPRTAGPANITVRVGALNDFNTSNDEQVIRVTAASPPAPPPPPASSGGGGGGSLNWLFAVLLALMWHHRQARRRVHR